ncbi:MAG: hypothetical protein DRG78_11705 [Epsilonproteobacteria bacterium]|nr:MAG: hypothetical protein DRG78_11705 [Campylobacterota bacterium]
MLESVRNLFIKNKQIDLSSFMFMESPVASTLLDKDAYILQVNHAFSELTGYSASEAIGEAVSILKSDKHDHTFYKNLWSILLESDKHKFEIWNKCKDGSVILIKQNVVKIIIDKKEYFLVVSEDITEERRLSNRQHHLATHDSLTGLANRTLLQDRFSQAVLHAKRNHKKMAIFICDLNEFKEVNDTYGHNFGDKVLQEVSDALINIVRESDTVARYGGDEFVIIAEQLNTSDKAIDILNDIKAKSSLSVKYDNQHHDISLSVGHACFPSDGMQFEQLINIADTRMYNQKRIYYGH